MTKIRITGNSVPVRAITEHEAGKLAMELSDFLKARYFPCLKGCVGRTVEILSNPVTVIIDGWVYITPTLALPVRNTVLGPKPFPEVRYIVSYEAYDPGVYRYPDGSGEPPSFSEVELDESFTRREAIRKVTDMLIAAQTEYLFEEPFPEDSTNKEET